MQFWLGLLALVLNLAGYVPYVRDIFRGIVRPQRVTWGIWTILTAVGAVNQVVNGGGYSSLFFVSTAFLVALVFGLSLKYGMGGASKLDRATLVLAVLLLVYWATVHDTRISTLVAVIIDAIGAVPTLLKTYRRPDTETYPQWVLAGFGGLFSMFAVARLDWVILIYPLYIILMNGTIVAVKYGRERFVDAKKTP